ncbi:MAG: ABC transporter permease subunit [Chloroflexi bacterium]|nr:MAG: ABC transporter permease subunit [Chloroflexota bacterium]
MEFLGQGLAEAIHRLVTLDADVVEALSASLAVSGTATALSVAIGVPAGTALGLARFRGRGLVLTLVNTGLGLPPVVVGIAVQSVDPMLRLQLRALGATPTQALWLFAREARLPILTAAMAGFGAVISEIGASLMVGCNVKGDTRILTTAITLETGKGEFGTAIALGIILLALVFAVNAATTWAQQRSRA